MRTSRDCRGSMMASLWPRAAAYFDEYADWTRQASAGKAAPPPMAARAQLALADGRLDEALGMVQQIVAWLDANPDVVDKEALGRRFACHRVLAAAGAPRADEFLARAHDLLLSQARALPEAERVNYLGNIRLHREIVAAWQIRTEQREPALVRQTSPKPI